MALHERALAKRDSLEVKILKQRVRDIISPQRDLGHIDRAQKGTGFPHASAPEPKPLPDAVVAVELPKEGQSTPGYSGARDDDACNDCA